MRHLVLKDDKIMTFLMFFLTLKLLVPLVVVTSHTETLNYDIFSLENDTEVVDPEFSGTSYDLCYFLT